MYIKKYVKKTDLDNRLIQNLKILKTQLVKSKPQIRGAKRITRKPRYTISHLGFKTKKQINKRRARPLYFMHRRIYYRGNLGLHSKLLKYIHGISRYRSSLISIKSAIYNYACLSKNKKISKKFTRKFNSSKLSNIQRFLLLNFLNGHKLKRHTNIQIKKKLADVHNRYALRFYQTLPTRGQRTKTNSRTVRSFFKTLITRLYNAKIGNRNNDNRIRKKTKNLKK